MELKYLRLLSKEYPSIESAASAIVNFNAIRSLPKGTEYFFSDLHGEYESFLHLLKSASGLIKNKIDKVFGKSITASERKNLANLIYYPEKRMKELESSGKLTDEWKKITIYRLILVCESVSAKYTRSKVREKCPKDFVYILDELLNVTDDINKDFYYEEIISSIIETGISEHFIASVCNLIQAIAIDKLHIIGDIFDRGPRADIIIDELMKRSDVDIQWGNHDISWIGACSGNKSLIANVIRIAISYNGFDVLEDGYGLNLRALSIFASEVYKDDDCKEFMPHLLDDNKYDSVDTKLTAKMHKAITIIQCKLEGQLIERHPEYNMNHRNLLPKVDFKSGTININGKSYTLKDNNFVTVNPDSPLELTPAEENLMNILSVSFRHSRQLNRHIKFLYSHGSMYKVCNSNLLYHGCIPMTENGSFESMNIDGKEYSGKKLLDRINDIVKEAYYGNYNTDSKNKACDFMWYLWCGAKSPIYGKDKMAFFERYFIDDLELHKEIYNPYYTLSDNPEICNKILKEFNINPESGHIINGHVPVKIKDGESPIKAGGKLYVIDGGISKAYRTKTGIAGYTLIYDSHSLQLAEHTPYNPDLSEYYAPNVYIVEKMKERVNISDTDYGKELEENIKDLKDLIKAYRNGIIQENP
ncbi:MAG: fructose-1,6-bisphosphatase [Oscillospiraceae bacterium]|nr:fructose-1,6-bisphosphatase [Oscillospiraceae bacterium]